MQRRRNKTALILVGISVALATAFSIHHFQVPETGPEKSKSTVAAAGPILAPDDEVHAQYAGSQTCRECHEAAFTSWQHSDHGLAERKVDKAEDNRFFTPKRTLTHGKVTTEAFLDAVGVAKFITQGLDHKRHTYEPVRVIGHDPLRQFLIPAPGNRLQTLDVSLDPAKNEWFDVFGNDPREPGDWGHWTGQGMNWNAMCAACHNTRVRKNFDPQTNSYHTTMAEMTVSCESCHGPLKGHVEWQKKPPLTGKKDPTIRKLTRDQMTETCAACHARRAELTGDLVPGDPFHDHFSLTLTDGSETFYPDGQIRDEDYEYTAFVASKMHHAGVRCADCHDPHSGKTLVAGNALCMTCHSGGRADFPTAPRIDPQAHSHHGVDSSGNQCVSCHMPVTTYMQRHPRHDHGFTIPDPVLTKEFNVPNACNRCHTDKDADWSIAAMKQFYGEKPDRSTHSRAVLVAKARRGDPSSRDGLIKLLDMETIPAWRATASTLLGSWVMEANVAQVLMKRLTDADPMVREAAVRSLGPLARQNDVAAKAKIGELLEDPSRSVRIAAAWALCDTLDLKSKAGLELIHMLDLNSDQPTGRMQLGQFAMARGDQASAIRQMKKAISMDPNSPPFHHDLAIALSGQGDFAGAVSELREAIRLDPDFPDYHFKLALALNETGATQGSIAEFEKTVALAPGYARAWYNLGLARSGMNEIPAAVQALQQAEAADPSDATIPYALATILARAGQKQAALEAAARAVQLRPNYQEARQLIISLSR